MDCGLGKWYACHKNSIKPLKGGGPYIISCFLSTGRIREGGVLERGAIREGDVLKRGAY